MYAGMSTIPQQAIRRTESLPALRLNPFPKIGFVRSAESEKTNSPKLKSPKSALGLVQFKHGKKRFLGHFDVADLLHSFLAAFLFLQQFAFTAHVTAVTFRQDIFANLFHGLPCDDFSPDGSLNSDVELLSWQQLFQFFAHAASEIDRIVPVCQGA